MGELEGRGIPGFKRRLEGYEVHKAKGYPACPDCRASVLFLATKLVTGKLSSEYLFCPGGCGWGMDHREFIRWLGGVRGAPKWRCRRCGRQSLLIKGGVVAGLITLECGGVDIWPAKSIGGGHTTYIEGIKGDLEGCGAVFKVNVTRVEPLVLSEMLLKAEMSFVGAEDVPDD